MKKIEMITEMVEHLKNTKTFNKENFANYAYQVNNWQRVINKAMKNKKEYIKNIYNLYAYGYYKAETHQQNFKLLYDLINI